MNNDKSFLGALKTINRYKLELVSTPLQMCNYVLGRQQKRSKDHFLIACMPKSGSTYFSSILECLPNVSRRDLCGGYGRREQELDPMRLILNHNANYVGQLHIRHTNQTDTLIRQFDLKPVVLVRDIYDTVISLRDHFRKHDLNWASMGYAYDYMVEWDDHDLEVFLVKMFIPWYFNFYLTWKNAKIGYAETYSNLIRDPYSTVWKFLDYYGCHYKEEEILKALENVSKLDTRLNNGSEGRGHKLGDIAKDEILKMAKFYDEDFSIIGIKR